MRLLETAAAPERSLPYAQASREAHPMLVLTRKSNQSIMIGDDIEVSVLAIMGEKVRIGIQAPRDIPGVPQGGLPRDPAGAVGAARARAKRSTRRFAGLRRDARPRRYGRRRARRSAKQAVERLEHRDRHDHRGGDQREHQQPEAHRAALLLALAIARCASAGRRACAECLPRGCRSSCASCRNSCSSCARLWRIFIAIAAEPTKVMTTRPAGRPGHMTGRPKPGP